MSVEKIVVIDEWVVRGDRFRLLEGGELQTWYGGKEWDAEAPRYVQGILCDRIAELKKS